MKGDAAVIAEATAASGEDVGPGPESRYSLCVVCDERLRSTKRARTTACTFLLSVRQALIGFANDELDRTAHTRLWGY
jgi:hypothetical protein